MLQSLIFIITETDKKVIYIGLEVITEIKEVIFFILLNIKN